MNLDIQSLSLYLLKISIITPLYSIINHQIILQLISQPITLHSTASETYQTTNSLSNYFPKPRFHYPHRTSGTPSTSKRINQNTCGTPGNNIEMPSLDSSPDRFIIPTFSNRATCFLIHIERAVNQRKSRSRTWPCAHDGAGSKRKKTERRTELSAVAARADRQHACSESVNVNYRGIGSRKGMIHGKRGFEDRGNRANELRLLVNFFHVWIVCPAI